MILNSLVTDSVTVQAAAREMAFNKMGCVALLTEKNQLAGVFTIMDMVSKVLLPKIDAKSIQMREVADMKPTFAFLSTTVLECAEIMHTR